ncbi:PREDICTED: uncharacterized protein LOC106749019 [Dinoponera quadriceps]|uniref:Uncharacterized protein LOC106749019 n=1 Tax=Dinoponera quadriceps TaxID=609295 RepID=A0A6P3XZN3_DINQU|nr:PREDICTED: uncharacterized protein LOC106749019 [Dinoponera quadriceps]
MSDDKKPVYSAQKGKRGRKSKADGPSILKRQRPLNRFEMEQPSENVDTSAKKLSANNSDDIEVNPSVGYRMIDFLTVFTAISQVVVCKKCKSDVEFTETGNRGLGFKIVITCKECDKVFVPSCSFIDKAYEINRRIILAMRLIGVGLHGIHKFCAFMDLPRPIFHSFYDSVVKCIHGGAEIICEQSMKRAAQEEKGKTDESSNSGGIAVSGDGSWRKREFSSLFGFVSLIGWKTGKVVDVSVKCKYCKACEFWKTKEGTAKYEEWLETHADECQANHEGSSGLMEVNAVCEMFQRSESLHNLKYTSYIGDGDSKTYTGIVNSSPYGDSIVQKKECIDHVQKRMGTHLRNLKKKTKGLGGKGKLTGKLIDELSIYYGLAIRRNHESVEKMRTAIYATLDHKLSTDAKPKHDHCPSGENSWCSWQRAKATGTLDEYTHKPPLHEEVYKAITPIYEKLTSDDLLTRCIGGFTQNSNESFNATVWSMAPKVTSSGKNVLDTAVYIAAGTYNDGLTSAMRVMQNIGIKIGPNCYNYCQETDQNRIKLSDRSLSDAARRSRIEQKASRKEEDEFHVSMEGEMYGAGIAD